MSRSFGQHHPTSRGKVRNPRPERKRKHKPYGMQNSDFRPDMVKRLGWSLDSADRWKSSDIQSKAKGRTEWKKDVERELELINF